MDDQPSPPEVKDALAVLQRYLSDAIAPLQAADSLNVLLSHPPVVAAAIRDWAVGAFRGVASDFILSDLLFLGVKRLYSFSEFRLLPEQATRGFLEKLKVEIVEQCPEEERFQLEQNLAVLAWPGDEFGATVPRPAAGAPSLLDPQRGRPGAPAAFRSPIVRRSRGIALVLDRMSRSCAPGGEATTVPAAQLAPQVFTAAARTAQNSAELDQACEILRSFGIPIGPEALFRMMGDNLPGWCPPPPRGEGSGSPILEAMSRIIQFAGTTREGAARWEGLVKAAVGQLNQGSASRAAAMIGLAENVVTESSVDPVAVAGIRSWGHQSVDVERLRSAVENAQNHPHLRKVMTFFDELRPDSLLHQLESEPKRSRRRLLLDLLEVHGEEARTEALRLLGLLAVEERDPDRWHFSRNLVYLLHRIRPASGMPSDTEFGLVARLLDPAGPPSLVKEAITFFGQYRHEKSEQCLAELVARLEGCLTGPGTQKQDPATLRILLDRTAFALARLGTAGSIRALRTHALKRNPALGNTFGRLVHLASQDLSGDPDSIHAIVKAAREALPRKVLGVMIRKESREITSLIASLSSTPAPQVRGLMKEIGERFPGEEYGQAALRYLHELEAVSRKSEEGGTRLMGDLDLFGLPSLLQQFERSRVCGLLSLCEKSGNAIGELVLDDGKLVRCTSGQLEGEAAFYRLLEKPAATSFVFQRQRPGILQVSGEGEPLALASLIEEGTRRFDEFEWLRVVVPDAAKLKALGEKPSPDAADPDEELCRDLWEAVKTGSSPVECESRLAREPLRIRRVLSRWLEAGLLSEQ